MRDVEGELRAIQVEGLGLALASPLKVEITGQLLTGGISTAVAYAAVQDFLRAL